MVGAGGRLTTGHLRRWAQTRSPFRTCHEDPELVSVGPEGSRGNVVWILIEVRDALDSAGSNPRKGSSACLSSRWKP